MIIQKAILGVYINYNNDIYEGRKINTHQLTKLWSDTFVTWEKNTPTTNWSTKGGDFPSVPVDADTYAKGETDTWLEFDVTDVIKDLQLNPDNNFGFILKNIGHNIAVRSSETINSEVRPKLVVTCDIENQFSPVVTFLNPDEGDTLSSPIGKDSVHVSAYDKDIDTTDGAGIAFVLLQLIQNDTSVDSITLTESPFLWSDFNTLDYQSGDYTLKSTTQSLPSAGGTSASGEVQVTIRNSNTRIKTTGLQEDMLFRIIKRGSNLFLLFVPYKQEYSVTITDIRGRQLISFTANPSKTEYLLQHNFSPGIHIVTLGTSEKRFVKKLLVVR